MKQILQSYRTGEIQLVEVPTPLTKRTGVLVQVVASVVSSGTERALLNLAKKPLIQKAMSRPDLVKKVLQSIRVEGFTTATRKTVARLDVPIPLGYSCAGIVVDTGTQVNDLRIGDRVACAGAGYATHAEFNFVPKNLCVKIPEEVGFDDASLTTLGAIALQGIRQAAVQIGERVVVSGLGVLGLLTAQLLSATGCSVLGIDPDGNRRRRAQEIGVTTCNLEDVDEAAATFTRGHGADAVLVTAATPSNRPIEQAARISRVKGRVVVVGLVGLNVPRDLFYKKELDLRFSMSYGPGRYDVNYEEHGQDYPYGYVRWTERRNMEAFLDLVAMDRVRPMELVTHRFGVEDALRAYELLSNGSSERASAEVLGILIDYPTNRANGAFGDVVELGAVTGTKRVVVGFAGAGAFATGVLLPKLKRQDDVELVGLCTASSAGGNHTARKFGFAYVTSDYEQLLKDPRINTIFVATRHDSHAKYATAAIEAGKHVFVEKPLCIHPEELDLYRQAFSRDRRSGVDPCLMVGFNRRFSPHAEAIRRKVNGHQLPLAITYRINAGVLPSDSWIQNPNVGGGRIVGEVCHFIDFCEYIVDAPVVRVFAETVRLEDSRTRQDDTISVTMTHRDGSLSVIHYFALGSRRVPKERVEICTQGMTAVLDDFTRLSIYDDHSRRVTRKRDKGFDCELAAFLSAIRDGTTWPISYESLVRVTSITFAVRESIRLGAPVAIDTGTPAA
jgi:predicted dehydrogenase